MSIIVIGLIAVGWLVLCALVVALCASAKEGDGHHASPEPMPEPKLGMPTGPPSLARR